MVVRSIAAPPTPWSTTLSQPKIHETAYVHSFSNIIGDVRIGPNVLVAPGTSIRADEGSPFHIGANTNIQDGVVIHGLDQGRVLGDDGQDYSVWIGNNASITHKALVHGPAYIGDDCFIGFRSTVFNARVGKGCIVMMHVLIQDVEIPPGRYIPSGAVITNQQQADRLPAVQPEDLKFASHVVGINDALRSGYQCAEDIACINSVRGQTIGETLSPSQSLNSGNDHYQAGTMRLSAETVQQVRQLLGSGYRIGTEHVDERRFRTNCWYSCSPIQSTREAEVFSALEACLTEHSGEYVRLIGIDPQSRRRVMELIIQRPGDVGMASSANASVSSYQAQPASYAASASNGHANQGTVDLAQQVQNLLNQGCTLGTEYADQRRYRAGAWQSGPSITVRNPGEAMRQLEAFLAEHEGEYVRLIGVDATVKRRVSETVIQTPAGKVVGVPATSKTVSVGGGNGYGGGYGSSSRGLSPEALEQIRQLLSQGYQLGTEYADQRRYRAAAWQSGPSIATSNQSEAISVLEAFLADHPGEYVRLIGVDPKLKRRVSETLIQSANGKIVPASASNNTSNNNGYSPATSNGRAASANGASSQRLSPDVLQQIQQLLNQGYSLGTEYADKRRFRSAAWQGGPSIAVRNQSEAIAALEPLLAEHEGEYVRLIGIDPKAKRRVSEILIQQPNGKA